MNEFFLTLVSNSSMHVFHDNKTASFTNLLPEKISLPGKWMVALAEVHYNFNFFNVTENNNIIYVTETSNNKDNNTIYADNIVKHEIFVEPGFYKSVNDLINTVNKMLRKFIMGSGILISLDSVNNRTIVHKNVTSRVETICFQGRLAMQLGFPPMDDIINVPISPHIGNTYLGIPNQMFIYTDIIEPTFIGHEKANVLKIISTANNNLSFGDICYKEYIHMHYMCVQKREFESISVDIRDYSGQLIPFSHGVLTLKLHFKCKDD